MSVGFAFIKIISGKEPFCLEIESMRSVIPRACWHVQMNLGMTLCELKKLGGAASAGKEDGRNNRASIYSIRMMA